MKKILIIFTLMILSSFPMLSQITGFETPPPTDQICYNNLAGCTVWSDWSSTWKTIVFPSGLNDGCATCSLYVNYKTRYCINDPTIVEMWIGAIGVDPMIGCPCPNTIAAFLADPTHWKMIAYEKIAFTEFEAVKTLHCCDYGEPPCCTTVGTMSYSMRWPGSCTMSCIYKRTNGAGYSITGDIDCYSSPFCCGRTSILCWDCKNQQIVETREITIGEGHNCNWPTGDCPSYKCPNPPTGWYLLNCDNCTDNCNYSE